MNEPDDLHRRPAPWRRSGMTAGPQLAATLAVIAIALVAAIALLPGLIGRPAGSPGPTQIAGGSATPDGSPTPTPFPSFVRPTPTPLPTFMTYTVRGGDSLNSIAHQFGTTARSIAWWNRGTYPSLDPESATYDPGHIELGWHLTLIPNTTVDDNNPPTPSPGLPTPTPGAPTAAPAATPLPSTSAGGPAIVVSHGSRSSGQIALTFDMGGRLDPALDIMTWLIDHDVHATIFPTGKTGTTTATGKAVLQLAATRPDLFDIGNHSWDHPDFTTLTGAQMADELASTETAIQALIGQTTKPWFRPPYGAWTAAVRAGVGAAGWSRVVMWDVDTIDWKATADGGPTKDDIVTKVVANGQGGSIVLMHLGGYHTLEALPEILAGLQGKGLTPVTLTELLGG